MDRLILISVVRDFAMYDTCIGTNAFVSDCEKVVFDNREKNESISVLYNRFLKGFDYSKPAWLMFCHEDFKLCGDIKGVIATLSPESLWGPIGAKTIVRRWGWCQWRAVGHVTMANKDGSEANDVGTLREPQEVVEALDCCCVLVHSSVFAKTGLVFDENLSFDLYVEDLCISANELFGIPSRAMSVPCVHFSKNSPQERYELQHRYLNRKWSKVSYSTPCSWNVGGRFGVRMVFAWVKECARNLLRMIRAKSCVVSDKSRTA